jgi:DNA repair exonuclease SbcCD nuclease subunit
MNKLFFSDIHIKISELEECSLVLNEILSLCEQYNIDEVFDLGDTFDKINPESECQDLFASFIKRLNRPITIISARSHESKSAEENILKHYGILSDKVTVVKEYNDEKYLYLGHFIVKESKKNYGGTINKIDLKQYHCVVLGHGHSWEVIPANIMQLGACRYIDFAESEDKSKNITICENYKTRENKWNTIALQSPYPMRDIYLRLNEQNIDKQVDIKAKMTQPTKAIVYSIEQFRAILNNLNSKSKIRVIFDDFESYKQVINILSEYKEKFVLFQEKKNYLIQNKEFAVAKKIDLKESLTAYLNDKKVNDEVKNILLEEIK